MIEEGRTTRGDFDFSDATGSVEGQITVDGVTPKKADITVTLLNEDGDEERHHAHADSEGYYRIEDLGSGNARLGVIAESLEGRKFFSAEQNVFIPEVKLGQSPFFRMPYVDRIGGEGRRPYSFKR